MELSELAHKYYGTAAALKGRAAALSGQLETAGDRQARWFLEERIARLETMVRESLACAALCERYEAMGYKKAPPTGGLDPSAAKRTDYTSILGDRR